MKPTLFYRGRWMLLYLPVLLGSLALMWLAATRWMPLPPRAVTLAAEAPAAGTETPRTIQRYRDELDRIGVAVDIAELPLRGGAMTWLARGTDSARAGFATGLQVTWGPELAVQALAAVGHQPVWFYTTVPGLEDVAGLRGRRVAAGPVGGTARRVAEMALAQAKVPAGAVTWDERDGLAAAAALLDKELDALVSIDSPEAPLTRMLTREPGVSLLDMPQAGALAHHEARLHRMVLPQGAIELRGDVPRRDLTLLSTNTNLVVPASMHDALQRALLDAASSAHAVAGFLERQSDHPDFETDFPLSPVAQRYAAGDRPWLERVLPYWWAQLAALALQLLLPIALATALLLAWIPRWYRLRVDALLAHYYGELHFIERDLLRAEADATPDRRALLARLDAMERDVGVLDLPTRYVERWYTLQVHLASLRARLLQAPSTLR